MLGILGDLKLIIGTVVAVAMLGVGYKVGARQVDALEAEIKTIKNEGDSEETRRKKAQAEIDKALAEVKTEHARQMEQLKAEGERKAKELDAALVGRDSRIADLQAQVSVNKAREAKLTGDLLKASPAERTKLQEQIGALRAENAVLVKKADANECLVLAVPDAVIGPLVK
jgi:chromosome segregation ATPase